MPAASVEDVDGNIFSIATPASRFVRRVVVPGCGQSIQDQAEQLIHMCGTTILVTCNWLKSDAIVPVPVDENTLSKQ